MNTKFLREQENEKITKITTLLLKLMKITILEKVANFILCDTSLVGGYPNLYKILLIVTGYPY